MAPAPILLEPQDQKRDLAFSKALHGKSAQERAGLLTVVRKDFEAQKAAVSEYFKYWGPEDETEQTRVVCRNGSSLGRGLGADIVLRAGEEIRIRNDHPSIL